MNYLYVIGNGFDLALGLKTSYQDFYDYYQKQSSRNDNIVALKESIRSGRYETWADLEIGLGQFTAVCSSEDAFIDCLDDVRKHLRIFLSQQEDVAKRTVGLLSFINIPWDYIDSVDLDRLQFDLDRVPSLRDTYSIVTLNYTSSIEAILSNESPVLIDHVSHLHGDLGKMVIGVNDESQIANRSFASNEGFREEFVKPIYNSACRNNRNESFRKKIEKANIIVIYGTSVGPSDEIWWHAIGDRLLKSDSAILLYFPYDREKDLDKHENYRLRWTKQYFKEIVKKIGIEDEQITDDLTNRIFIAINISFLEPIKATVISETSIETKGN